MFKKILLFLAFISISFSAHAAVQNSKDYNAINKLQRGFANVLGGPLELVKRPCIEVKNEGPTMFFPGFVMGYFDAASRIIVGAFEVVTFPLPLSKDWTYRPIVYPDYIWEDWYEPMDFDEEPINDL